MTRTASMPITAVSLLQPGLFERAAEIPTELEVVSAPLAELGSKRIPRTLKKANAVVHVYPVKGKYSLVMNRMFNALLALAYTKLKGLPDNAVEESALNQTVLRFEASGADIKKLIGQENVRDYQGLYDTLDSLMAIPVVWDALDTEGARWKIRSTLLSQWGRSEESGMIAWYWMPDILGLLFNPNNRYTLLDLELARTFNSKYTLALYENCFRYYRIAHTPWRPTRDWVLLIAGPELYPDYREFKRAALKKAMLELEKTPGCSITVSLEEKRGLFNRVEAIRFVIKEKSQAKTVIGIPVAINSELETKLLRLGVSDFAVKKLIHEYDQAYLEVQLDLTLREKEKGRVKNAAAWFMSAVGKRYEDQIAQFEAKAETSLIESRAKDTKASLEAEFFDYKISFALRWLGALSVEEQESLKNKFLAQANETIKKRHAVDGFKGKMVDASFKVWLCKQDAVCVSYEIKDLRSFVAFKQSGIGHG